MTNDGRSETGQKDIERFEQRKDRENDERHETKTARCYPEERAFIGK